MKRLLLLAVLTGCSVSSEAERPVSISLPLDPMARPWMPEIRVYTMPPLTDEVKKNAKMAVAERCGEALGKKLRSLSIDDKGFVEDAIVHVSSFSQQYYQAGVNPFKVIQDDIGHLLNEQNNKYLADALLMLRMTLGEMLTGPNGDFIDKEFEENTLKLFLSKVSEEMWDL